MAGQLSAQLLDKKCSQLVKDTPNSALPTSTIDVGSNRYHDEDVVQETAIQAWMLLASDRELTQDLSDEDAIRISELRQDLRTGDEFTRETAFRELLDCGEYDRQINSMHKMIHMNKVRNSRTTPYSRERAMYDVDRQLSKVTLHDDNDAPALRTVSLEWMCRATDEDLGALKELIDPTWEEPFLEAEEDGEVSIIENPTDDQREAIDLMRHIQWLKERGLPTNSDSIKGRLKRHRQKTGWALKTTLLCA